MSTTPRTNAVTRSANLCGRGLEVVPTYFARKLETELAEARAVMQEAVITLREVLDHADLSAFDSNAIAATVAALNAARKATP
jgi:bacillopeptidase F (M6 metalloprotease family)